MSIIELNEFIFNKLGVHASCDGMTNVLRFRYLGNAYRVNTDLNVEKVDGPCLVSDSDTQQLEKLLRGEQWDGTGLPPVGTEFEYGTHHSRAKCIAVGHHMVFASKGDPDDEEGEFEEFMISIQDSEFRPLRTERDKAIEQIAIYVNNTAAENLYDVIVAGKIDGLGKVG